MTALQHTGKAAHGPSLWEAADVARITAADIPEISLISADDVRPLIDGLDLWDSWPIQHYDGTLAMIDGTVLWMMLSAPAVPDPVERHSQARIRLMAQSDGAWIDCGNALPDGLSPGTREWAGSAVLNDDGRTVTLYFTATGRPDEAFSFEQRLFETTGTLRADVRAIERWSTPVEIVASDGHHYVDTRTTQGGPGLIMGFRDPGYVRDPADGAEYLVFTGSDGASKKIHNGVIGLISLADGRWTLEPPIYSALGLCNELERPHVIVRDGLYYLFWSTQRHVFAPGGPSGPNGLYGAVATALRGPYRALNGTGLVAANPCSEPTQAYSWLVLDTLDVVSFVDYWGMAGRSLADYPALVRSQFGGTVAPMFRIAINGDTARLVTQA